MNTMNTMNTGDTMNAPEYLLLSAHYNRWVNERLYGVCSGLDDSARRRDLGAYFRSLHGTLNHLLLADRLWLARITGATTTLHTLDQELYSDFAELRTERALTDAVITDRVVGLSSSALALPVRYVSVITGNIMTLSTGTALIHMFHHQTHYRGQVTALLSQLGQGYGAIDMVWMPGVAAVSDENSVANH